MNQHRLLAGGPLGLAVADRLAASTGSVSLEAVLEMVVEVVRDLTPHDPSFEQRCQKLALRREALEAVLQRTVSAEVLGHLFADLDHTNQWHVSADSQRPTASGFRPPGPTMTHAPKPVDGFWTCTGRGRATEWLQHRRVGEHAVAKVTTWAVSIADSARVIEIHDPSDWQRLCELFPSPAAENGGATPDFRAMRQAWDGVHLSTGGLLAAQFVTVALGSGTWCRLDGWDAEGTLWLNWCVNGIALRP